jgi:hypothetical protein
VTAPFICTPFHHFRLKKVSKPFSLSTGNSMPIRVHVSQLSDKALREKLGIKQRAKPREAERQHQVALIRWVKAIEDAYPVLKLLYAVPNGGDRNLYVARKLKAEGVRAGVADLCLPVTCRKRWRNTPRMLPIRERQVMPPSNEWSNVGPVCVTSHAEVRISSTNR